VNKWAEKAKQIKENALSPHEYWAKTIYELCYPDTSPVKFNDAWEALKLLYNEPHRRYHNWNHPHTMLGLLTKNLTALNEEFIYHTYIPRSMKELIEVAPHLVLAILYHDAVYNPGSNTNEEDSAELAYLHLGHHSKLAKAVALLVTTTKFHQSLFNNVWDSILIDLDLSFLGIPREEYNANTEDIMFEYSSICTPEQFAAGRKEFCRKFLQRPDIYRTATFRKQFEKQARENLRFGSL